MSDTQKVPEAVASSDSSLAGLLDKKFVPKGPPPVDAPPVITHADVQMTYTSWNFERNTLIVRFMGKNNRVLKEVEMTKEVVRSKPICPVCGNPRCTWINP